MIDEAIAATTTSAASGRGWTPTPASSWSAARSCRRGTCPRRRRRSWTSALRLERLLAIEGPGWLVEDRWADPAQRPAILRAIRSVETEPTLLGQSSHLLAVARRP